jgi:hypothetical protein
MSLTNLKEVVAEAKRIRVQLQESEADGEPICDGKYRHVEEI